MKLSTISLGWYNRRGMKCVQVRKAIPPDAAGIVKVLEAVTAERIHSAIDQVWTVEHKTATSNPLRRARSFT